MMLLNQSFIRNLLVLFALCVLLIEAAPIKVRKMREPGSSQEEVPRLPKRVTVRQPFAPYRAYKKRQTSPFSFVGVAKASSSLVSSSVSSVTPTAAPSNIAGDLTSALGAALGGAAAPVDIASLLSSALGAAITTTTTQPTTTTAPLVPAVPAAIASFLAAELSIALGGASVPPALASQFSSALAIALASPTAAPSSSASSLSVSSASVSSVSFSQISASSASQSTAIVSATASSASVSSTQATGTTVTISVNNLPTPVSSQATGTTVTISVNNLPTPVVGAPKVGVSSAPPSLSSTSVQCTPTNVFNRAEIHANPRKNIVLFKAIPNDAAQISALVSNANPPRNEKGDFSNTGAFYLTDTWQAAAQAACYGSGQALDSVAVISYNWNPMPDTKIIEFRSANTQWRSFVNTKNSQFVLNNDMIAGPPDFRKDITTAFWQYAINSDKGMQSLDLSAIYQPVFCKDIPRGNCLPLTQ